MLKAVFTALILFIWNGPALAGSKNSKSNSTSNLVQTWIEKISLGQCEHLHKELQKNPKILNAKTKEGNSLLLAAVQFDQRYCLKVLIDAQVELNQSTLDGLSTLQLAVSQGSPELIRQLGNAKVDLTVVDSETGETPLHQSVRKGDIEVVKAVLEIGVNPKIKNLKKQTALDLAQELKYNDLVKVLEKK